MRNFHKLQLYSGPIIKDILFHSLVLIGTNSSETSVCVLRSLPFFLFLRSFPHEFNFRSFPYPLKTKNKTPHPGLWYLSESNRAAVQENKASSCKLGKLWVKDWIFVTATRQGQSKKIPLSSASSPSLTCQPYSLHSNGAAEHRRVAAGILLGLQGAFTQASKSLLALIKVLNNNQLSLSKTPPFVQDFSLPHF